MNFPIVILSFVVELATIAVDEPADGLIFSSIFFLIVAIADKPLATTSLLLYKTEESTVFVNC